MQRAATIARGSLRSARRLETRARPNGARRLSAKASQYEIRAQPAPGVPFHVAIPVHNIDEAKAFYGGILGCEEGRSSTKQGRTRERNSQLQSLISRPGSTRCG